MNQPEPIREITVCKATRLYVSDVGCLVIEQDDGDEPIHCVFHVEHALALIGALATLAPVAEAIEAKHLAEVGEALKAWEARGEVDPRGGGAA